MIATIWGVTKTDHNVTFSLRTAEPNSILLIPNPLKCQNRRIHTDAIILLDRWAITSFRINLITLYPVVQECFNWLNLSNNENQLSCF